MIIYNGNQKGYIHSVETGGMVDGPGIRYVAFFSGCPLRCKYCHNPDTWKLTDGQLVSVSDMLRDIVKYRSYLTYSGGGVTITGGDPFVQPDFLVELLAACKSEGIHTTLDTSGYTNLETANRALKYVDLLLLDIKSYNPETYKELTGVPLDRTLEVFNLSRSLAVPTWVRFVLVPGYTDNEDDMRAMSKFLKGYGNVEKVEVLAFHKMGEYKWETLGIPYELKDVLPPSPEQLNRAKAILEV